MNGWNAYLVSHIAFIVLSFGFGVFNPAIVALHHGGLLQVCNIVGWSIAFLAYIKAHTFPTYPDDMKFSGSRVYDFLMGIELNPRFGEYFDFKLFLNGRPGICGWTIVNLSFAAAQY